MEEHKNMTDAKLLARRIAQRAYLDSEEEIAGWIMEFASLYERQQQFQKVMDGPYVDFDKPNIFMDGDNNSYSLMTSSDPEKREKGRQIRIHELVTRINQLEAERSELRTIEDVVKAFEAGKLAGQSELRNKVIEEAVSKFEQAIKEINPHAYGSAYESVTLNKVIDFLNSLKTK